MHRTQIYFEETLFQAIKQRANRLNVSVSAFIRDTLKKELEAQALKEQPVDFSDFAGMWQDYDVTQDDKEIDLSDFLKDIFSSYYTEFLLNFGTEELMSALSI